MEEPPEIEHWKRISVLGSGAFGVVSLWQHKNNGEYIAIKKCKFQTSGHLSERQRRRWENEVQIMQSLNCENIVSFKPLPKGLETGLLKCNPTKLPLLSMEYCMKGNLRHVLTQVKNLSGLQEQDVRIVLNDITNAVSYLHKNNITHRDIKPENIVLQTCNDRPGDVIYKLIDLGYAKEIKDSIVSFVGTLHYLAPEIMRTEKYDSTVDYWSLGIVAFEVICGVLPFLPYYTPMERFPYIEKKKPEDICIYQLHSGSVAYSSELLKENYISTCLKQNLEVWLRRLLQFDPVLRGGDLSTMNIFDYLLKILAKKIVTVFSVHTLEFYSYEINEGTLVSTLKDWISRDTKVHKNDQVLLSSLENFDITDDKYVTDILPLPNATLFVFKKGAFVNRETFKLPKYVTILFQNCTTKYKWRDLRQIYTKSLFFLSQEEKMLNSLKTAFKLCNLYIHSLHVKLKDSMQQLHKTLSNVLIRIDCYHNLHNNRQLKLNTDCCGAYRQYLIQFQQLMSDLEKCIQNANDFIKKVDVLCKRQTVLDQVLPKVVPVIKSCDISDAVAQGTDLIVKGGNNENLTTPIQMVKIVSKALKEKDKLLNNKNFQNYSKAVLMAVKDVEIVQNHMDAFHKHVKDLSKAIDDNQRAQYQSLLAAVQPKKKVSAINGFFNSFVYYDADTIINQNQELRCQIEDVIGEMFATHRKFCEEMQLTPLQKIHFSHRKN